MSIAQNKVMSEHTDKTIDIEIDNDNDNDNNDNTNTDKTIDIEIDNDNDNNDNTNTDKTIDIEVDNEHSPEPEPGDNKISIVSDKSVKSLTDDERAIIVANAKNGIEQPYFDVKYFSNGNYRIVKRKKAKPTVAQKVMAKAANIETKADSSKVYYTNDQLLLEHIIELNSKFDKLMNKHKKLKHKYQTLCTDLYIDDDDRKPEHGDNSEHSLNSINERSPEHGNERNPERSDDEHNSERSVDERSPEHVQTTAPHTVSRGKKIRWRDQVNFA